MFEEPLRVALAAGAASIVLELLGFLFKSRLVRRLCYAAVIPTTSFAAVVLLAADLRLATVLAAVVAIYRAINSLRVIEARTREPRLGHASRRTTLYLVGLQLLTVGFWRVGLWLEPTALEVIYWLLAVSLLAGCLLVLSVRRNLSRSSIRPSDEYTSDGELPTVSVCIPARNETADLPSCLGSIIKSDYPKLEILVLDDCSQDKTSEIIKGFAQNGVRFIAGEPPRSGWLAKNQAYQTLAEAASGELILFCGVDVRFGKDAIRTLVGSMMARKKQMISLLPKGLQTSQHASLVQPMRYWWELALPRRLFNRPPVLSTAWLINRQSLFGKGEFRAVKSSVLPEGYFARELTKSDEYSFMRASGKLDISTAKRLPEQWDTAVRVRYPRLRKRPENILLVTLAEVWFLALPLGLFLLGFFMNLEYLWLLAGINTLLLAYVHLSILKAWSLDKTSLSLALFPVAVVVELMLMQVSMWRYEFSEVKWKDRNICIPVMRHIKHLPRQS